MASVGNTALPTSSTDDGDVEKNEPVVDQAAPVPPVLQTNVITDAITDIGDVIDGDTTTADGMVIPKGVIVNTACIIFGDFAATFIAYAVITNINIFGELYLHYDRDDVDESNLIIVGLDAVFFLLTGCFTDWYGGYYPAMHIYGVISFIGTCTLLLITFNWSVFGPSVVLPITARRIIFFVAQVVINLGVSGINVTAPPFAARQIEKYGIASIQSCFHYIYTVVQCAPLLALTSLSFIQLNVSFFCGYLSTVAVSIFTMLFFKYVRRKFREGTPDKGKATTLIVKAAASAVKSKVTTKLPKVSACCNCNCCPNLCSSVQDIDEESVELLAERAPKSTSTTGDVADTVESTLTLTTSVEPSGSPSASIDKSSTIGPAAAAASYGTIEPSTAETTAASLPEAMGHALWVCYAILLLSCELPYSIVRYQISTSYVSQAERMKPTILGQAVSSSLLQRYLPLLGIALAPFVNVYIYPYISKRFTILTMPNRTIIGIVFATLSVLSAAIVEKARMTFIDRGDYYVQEINNQSVIASDLTLDFLIPQYFFMGVADVFIFITGLEFAFTQSPCTMQAIVTGIFFFYQAIGRIVAILLVPLINTITAAAPWYPHEINDGHLNYYFLVLTAISLTNLIIFCLMEKGYEVVEVYMCPDADTSGSVSDATPTAGTAAKTTTPMTSVITKTSSALPQPLSSTTSSM